MENNFIFISAIIVFILIGLAVVVFKNARKEKREPDYRAFFIIGISWIPLGMALDVPTFWIMGLIFMLVGAGNKDKWKTIPAISERSGKFLWLLVIVTGLLVLTTITIKFLE